MHLSGYAHQSSLNNSGGEVEQKENYQNIVKKFKPEKSKKNKVPVSGTAMDENRMKLKQEIKKTRPKKSTSKDISL